MKDKQTPYISVIVPIYGVERYIEKCVRSLMEQTLENIEFIFIDDCSPDKSVEILMTALSLYPHRQPNSKIIRLNQNSGLANARCIGIKEAQGEYIINCDSDDWVEPEAYERMYSAAKSCNADMVVADLWFDWGNKKIIEKDNYIYCSGKETLENIYKNFTHCYVFNKLIRRSILQDNNISPIIGLNLWEDVCTTLQALYFTNKIIKIDQPFYHYRQNNNSICNRIGLSKTGLNQKIGVVDHIENFLATKKDYERFKNTLDFYKLLCKDSILNHKFLNEWLSIYPEAHRNVDSLTSLGNQKIRKIHLAIDHPISFRILSIKEVLFFRLKQIIKKIIGYESH